jgi:hypothetical protein
MDDVRRLPVGESLLGELVQRGRDLSSLPATACQRTALGDHRSPDRKDAKQALEVFREEYGPKYPKALAKLDLDWTQLTAAL